MSDAWSKSAINRLGERLRKAEEPSESDLTELNRFVAAHGEAIAQAQAVIRPLSPPGSQLTSRSKTVRAIVEKLKRQRTRLSQMQDIAGLRLVIDGGREAQDQLVSRLVEAFASAQVDDRRAKPQHGYRAVHVIVLIDERWVEIQVRTRRQHQWAEQFEKLADLWGRGIRYGDPPDAPDTVVAGDETRASMTALLQHLSDSIARVETWESAAEHDSFAVAILAREVDDLLKSWSRLL